MVRVSDLATEYNVSPERLLEALQKAGAQVTGGESAVEPAIEAKFREFMQKRRGPDNMDTPPTPQRQDGSSVDDHGPSVASGSTEVNSVSAGIIKFVDAKSCRWGFITSADGVDIFFQVADFEGPLPSPADAGQAVEFQGIEETARGPQAKTLRLVNLPVVAPSRQAPRRLGDSLATWAFLPFFSFEHRNNGRRYSSILHLLADVALDERWHLGAHPTPENPFPILESYLKYTFHRLQREDANASGSKKIIEQTTYGSGWAVFNTGLVDNLYEPIFALFEKNDRPGRQPWKFYDFCVPGEGRSGKKLTDQFDPLPEPARYFDNTSDMLLDTSKEIHLDIPHIVLDGIKRNRYPVDFLEEHLPRGFACEDYTKMTRYEREQYLDRFSDAVRADHRCYREIKARIEDATDLALKRTRWNFKTAIPQYYPRFDQMSFLLPLAIQPDENVDVALVISRNLSGSYQGSTILPLDWAYKNARLVCRPDSDWLSPTTIRMETGDED